MASCRVTCETVGRNEFTLEEWKLRDEMERGRRKEMERKEGKK